ncbi:uncharacterized protein [Drosophila pseudoobscura]|uniref:Uncharacterized protein isoform X2 n=1 Tax=Drosophila pseudoobscura pseudoobscura TaxID=46245 RepID=A0A6I8VQQ5_DROPS|nr:uncharacterized protein LOC26532927 isoform X2 [Drosophila pseudoobscura]
MKYKLFYKPGTDTFGNADRPGGTYIPLLLSRRGQMCCDEQLVYKMTNIECLGNPERVQNFSHYLKAVNMDCYITVPLRNPVGHLYGRNGFLDPSLVPPFTIGFYQVSGVVVDRNAAASEYVGTVKFFLQAMEAVKSKKRPTSKKQ